MLRQALIAFIALLTVSALIACGQDAGQPDSAISASPVATAKPTPSDISSAAQRTLDLGTGTYSSTLFADDGVGNRVEMRFYGAYDLDVPTSEVRLVLGSTAQKKQPRPATRNEPHLLLVYRGESAYARRRAFADPVGGWRQMPLALTGEQVGIDLGRTAKDAVAPKLLSILARESLIEEVQARETRVYLVEVSNRGAADLVRMGRLMQSVEEEAAPEDLTAVLDDTVELEVTMDVQGRLSEARADLTPLMNSLIKALFPDAPADQMLVKATSEWKFEALGEPVDIPDPTSEG